MTKDQRNLEKAALRGEPSYVWRAGQERRLALILEATGVRIHGQVLENGCGVGMYLKRLAAAGGQVFGLEVEPGRAAEARANLAPFPNAQILCAAGERLPFPAQAYDLVLSHEVLEHVQDDRLAVQEMARVLRPGGRIALFVPNRGYPFETHGIYWRGQYHFGNIPLVNYLPRRVRDRLAPHVRIYTASDLQRLFANQPLRVVKKTIIFGAYDNIIARYPGPGRILRGLLQWLEHTPLCILGLSHFWVLERI
jgi:SAM-dependent methyltransferase